MADEHVVLREWHRLFGLVLTDYFSDTPFTVEIERDLSEQQQFLDVVIVRRRRGRFRGQLPDGMGDLATHNLITFKSHHESLDSWAMKELVGHSVTYRKIVSRSPSQLLPEDQFRMYAVCARFPQTVSGQVPWQERQAGVYDCQWGTDTIPVIVAGELPREAQNAPFHLFSASPELLGFGRDAYRRRSETTSQLLGQLLEGFQREGLIMYTMADFERDYIKKHFSKLTPAEQQVAFQEISSEKRREILKALPLEERLADLSPEERLADLSPEQIRHYLDQLTASRPAEPRKPRRKK